MARKQRLISACTYCGKNGTRADDHIPPKNLFPDPKPSDLVTVPCCDVCNRSASLDDEYFRLVTVFRADVSHHGAARELWQPVFRSMNIPQKQGFRNAFVRTLKPVQLRSPAGLYLGETGTFQTDFGRVANVIKRVTRGFYFHETGTRLSPDTEILVLPELNLSDPHQHDLVSAFAGLEEKSIGGTVFSYRRHLASEQPEASAWLFIFYEEYAIFSMTMPRDPATGDQPSKADRD